MAGKIKSLLVLGAVVLTTAALAWAGADAPAQASGAPKPVITKAVKGEQCVEDTDFMRRNHMKLLKHQRDKTVIEGIRTKKHSLKECIECHASEKTGSVAAAKGDFCVSCHSYAAVKQQVSAVTRETVAQFVQRHLPPSQLVRSDALASLVEIGKTQHHAARVTPPDKAGEWLPWVHIAIGNLKAFLLGTYHGVSSKYLQEYLNEFCYRFNRREWEAELPLRLLNACLTHTQVKLRMV